jgi:hypothetical protein
VGFVTLAALLSLSLPDESLADLAEARARLARAGTLRKGGAVPVPVLWTSTAAPGEGAVASTCRARFSVLVGPDALADLVGWLTMEGGSP